MATDSLPPIDTRFELGDEITPEQAAFLDTHGFIIFSQVASPEEVRMISDELDRIEEGWFSEDRKWVRGIPVFVGKLPGGKRYVQRFTFASTFSERIKAFVRDARFEPIRRIVGEDARVGDEECDGVVVNRYMNVPGSVHFVGWHTDGLRELLYGRMPSQMFNIGLHLDECPADNGGLRLIPGTHKQGAWDMLFRKRYFVSHDDDPDEIVVETKPGDLTVHDGRLWHRVAKGTRTGETSLRRSMYVPYLTGPYAPKDENSSTPFYHHIGRALRAMRTAFA